MHIPHTESETFIDMAPVFTINSDSLTGRSNCSQMHCDWLVPEAQSSCGVQLPV